MKVSILLLLGLLLSATIVRSQDNVPFTKLEQQVKRQQGGWNGDKSVLSKIFNEERKRLGDQFEASLLTYIGADPERHYWIALFLTSPSYLHGGKPVPQLSMRILEQGIKLLRDKTDEDSVGSTLSFNVFAAVLSQKLGLMAKATSHKNEVERRLAENRDWGAFFPALSDEDRELYDSIPSSEKSVRTSLPTDKRGDRPRTRVSQGVLNGKAKVLGRPRFPADIDASGQVIVSIVYDEAGKVIYARAISGPPLLFLVAEEAARKTLFPPFTVEGKAEKVSGVLIYNFVR
jgi:hypothetical protein